MKRWFNTAGPCNPAKHYTLPPTARLPNVKRLIEQESYFVLHAPRQTGKTTAMLNLAQQLTASGDYTAVMVSVEVGAPYREDIDRAERDILSSWQMSVEAWLPKELRPSDFRQTASGGRLSGALGAWSKSSSRPLVVFIDEIDALQEDVLLSVLRQLRSGFPTRPHSFPQSLALIGLRDVRDYKIASGGSDRLNTASPFNIKVQSFTIDNFTQADVEALYAQHTTETRQVFTEDAIAHAFYLTQGQPWLVNALAKEAVEELVPNPTEPITTEHIEQAKEILIARQDTHLDSLAERLRQPRIQAVIEPIVAGSSLENVPPDDIQYVLDMGLCRRDHNSGLVIANPIYREIVPKNLAFTAIASLPAISPTWLTEDGTLDTQQLLDAFLSFWRQHGQPLLATAPYHEIAPHIVLMAFLHRVANGGGSLTREYAIGTDRMDICLRYQAATIAMELKVWRDQRPDPLKVGLEQLDKYLTGLALDTGWLVIFDQRSRQPPIAERTTTETVVSPGGRDIIVVRA